MDSTKNQRPGNLAEQLANYDVTVEYHGDEIVVTLDGVKAWSATDPHKLLRKCVIDTICDGIRDQHPGFKKLKDVWVNDVKPERIFEDRYGKEWYTAVWPEFDFQKPNPDDTDRASKASTLLNRLKRKQGFNIVYPAVTGVEAIMSYKRYLSGFPLRHTIVVNDFMASMGGLPVGSMIGPERRGYVTFMDLLPFSDLQQLEAICIVHEFGKKTVPQVHCRYEFLVATPEEEAEMEREIADFRRSAGLRDYSRASSEAVVPVKETDYATEIECPAPLTGMGNVQETIEVVSLLEQVPVTRRRPLVELKPAVGEVFDTCFGEMYHHTSPRNYKSFKLAYLCWLNSGGSDPTRAILPMLDHTSRLDIWRATTCFLTCWDKWMKEKRRFRGVKIVDEEHAHLRRRIKRCVFGETIVLFTR